MHRFDVVKSSLLVTLKNGSGSLTTTLYKHSLRGLCERCALNGSNCLCELSKSGLVFQDAKTCIFFPPWNKKMCEKASKMKMVFFSCRECAMFFSVLLFRKNFLIASLEGWLRTECREFRYSSSLLFYGILQRPFESYVDSNE